MKQDNAPEKINEQYIFTIPFMNYCPLPNSEKNNFENYKSKNKLVEYSNNIRILRNERRYK